ncbi:hypothetical protein E2C01_079996 [Portunus trituberculatus]|uniref:Uncharacterized protein n=1 Tax=Portunus trituberculatus TaxID=210409 RepID=A0A5B7IMY3_PORTR|nr:hypothetical protein [Portunus trituberculatus]
MLFLLLKLLINLLFLSCHPIFPSFLPSSSRHPPIHPSIHPSILAIAPFKRSINLPSEPSSNLSILHPCLSSFPPYILPSCSLVSLRRYSPAGRRLDQIQKQATTNGSLHPFLPSASQPASAERTTLKKHKKTKEAARSH